MPENVRRVGAESILISIALFFILGVVGWFGVQGASNPVEIAEIKIRLDKKKEAIQNLQNDMDNVKHTIYEIKTIGMKNNLILQDNNDEHRNTQNQLGDVNNRMSVLGNRVNHCEDDIDECMELHSK